MMLAAAVAASPACGGGARHASPGAAASQRVANLHAFARLYGVVRWFHPSDAAAAVDWDRLAIDGAHRVVDAPDARALRARLTEVFAAIAPTMHIVAPGETFPNELSLHPASTAGLDVVGWQHRGYGDNVIATSYASKRLHRDRRVAVPGALFAALWQSVDAAPFRGARLRLRCKLRTAGHAEGRLWLRVDRREGRGFFDNLAQHPVIGDAWTEAQIVGTVDSDATRIVFGPVMMIGGAVWYDDFELSISEHGGPWTPIPISNAGFEMAELSSGWSVGIGRAPGGPPTGWRITVDRDRPASGRSSLRVERVTQLSTEELFDQAPAAGETVDADLGGGLRARVPIALYSKQGRTIGDDPEAALRAQLVLRAAPVAGYDAVAGAADVIMAWNVFEHFWPYRDVVSTDWMAALDAGLADALAERSVEDHVATLERLTAASPDGHVNVACRGEATRWYPPFNVELVENQVAVTASVEPEIERGDVIVAIDHVPAQRIVADVMARISGSRQWQVVAAVTRFATGTADSRIAVRIRRDGQERSVIVARRDRPVFDKPAHAAIERLEDGTYYVDLTRTQPADIEGAVDALAGAPGIVFDVRGRPNAYREVLSHLQTRRDEIRKWETVPQIIRPDRPSSPASWKDTTSTNMPVLQLSITPPHFAGRVAFVTDAHAISAAEDFMTIVEYYRVGEIVGGPTAGTDGDIAQLASPTGCTIFFTGRRVTKPDGSRLLLIGVKPTIPAARTLAGVRAGRDELLERALVYVRGK